MSSFNFEISDEEDLILLDAYIENKYAVRLALDTAATHTTIDSNILYFSGYDLKRAIGEREIETSNGIIEVEVFNVSELECLGITKSNFEVQVYDFKAHGVNSDYDGVIGIDFLIENKICIDFRIGEITIN
jgi:hypothetical protein